MPKVQFILAIHNHQPVGNFDFVVEEAYQKAYLPFINVLEKHPKIRVSLHYTGILYRFFEQRHPEFIEILKKLVRDGRAEILSGGFYEPILTVLPDEDKVGQIRALSDYIHATMGNEARGMWLAERVWEPHLPKCIAAAGIEYVVVDDFHFKMAGLHDDELDGYYLTEEQDALLKIFPGNETLRYLIPFRPPEETIDLLANLRSPSRNRLICMADDGEKFGIWPETHRSVYEEGWLERFFSLLEQHDDWLETTTFSRFLDQEPTRGKIFLPTASYMEMGEWALPPRAMDEYNEVLTKIKGTPDFDKMRPFIKGGIWRNFLAKYSESNHLHKRMLMVSAKVREAVDALQTGGARSAESSAAMLDNLYQAQCNDAYWHGVFGGLYLPHLRAALYERLIAAEQSADAVRYGSDAGGKSAPSDNAPSWVVLERGDFDRDGDDEVMLNSELLNLFIDPADGGRIAEIDWKPRLFNLTNTLTRRREGYHGKILLAQKATGEAKTIHERILVKEEGLEHHLQYDWYTRGCLLDHFIESGVDLAGFMRSEYYEAGDFVLGRYNATERRGNDDVALTLERNGTAAGLPVRLQKNITLRRGNGGFDVRYLITNTGSEELNTTFGSEFHITLLAGNAPDRYYDIPGHVLDKKNLASTGETNNVERIRLVDEWLKMAVNFSFSKPAVLWRAPVETVSQSEGGFERVYQSSMIMPLWRLSLGPDKTWEMNMRIDVE